MPKEFDFQTTDWCPSMHAVTQGEKMIRVLRQMMTKRGKTSVSDVMVLTDCNRRTVQRYLCQLEQAGYIQRDGAKPAGFNVTEKTKQIFTVKVTAC